MSRAMMTMEGQRRRPSLKESIGFILKEGTGTGPRQGEGEGEGEGQKKSLPAPPVPAPVPSSNNRPLEGRLELPTTTKKLTAGA